MAGKNKGLGRGLDALIPTYQNEQNDEKKRDPSHKYRSNKSKQGSTQKKLRTQKKYKSYQIRSKSMGSSNRSWSSKVTDHIRSLRVSEGIALLYQPV